MFFMVELGGYKLKPRHYEFIRHYSTIGSPSYGNATESIRKSGFKGKNASRTAISLLNNPRIVQEISKIEQERAKSFDWSYNDWLKKGTDCFDELPSTNANKVRFWEIIGKAKNYIVDEKVNNNFYILNSDDINHMRMKLSSNILTEQQKTLAISVADNNSYVKLDSTTADNKTGADSNGL